jgi:predicted phage baseplate assembly protein
MPLPTPNLDDLRFQTDLVDEARRRIVRYCPEWTEYNVSDPGVTLIELFAWMTEQLAYRLNRVPDKNYVKFLELLGVQLLPASSARTELTFRLAVPFPLNPEDETMTVVPQGTEVATWPTDEEQEVVFTTDERLVIAPPSLVELRREQQVNVNYRPRLEREDFEFYAFDPEQPRVGDTFYLGFDPDQDVSGYILRLDVEARATQAPGIVRQDPPLVWECSLGEDEWEPLSPSTEQGERDTTGGLNNARGSLVLYLPLSMRPDRVHGRRAYWVRCRLEPRDESQGMYSMSPRLTGIQVYVLGATTPATHAQVVPREELGRSSGEPGQRYHLQHAPVLALQPGETVEVEEERDGEPVYLPWTRVDDFSASSPHDRHFTLDEATGEVGFGPCIIQPDGATHQYGRVPEARRGIRMSRYRHGGGVQGNVPARRIQVLRSAIPYVDRVSNERRASGGRDQESLEEAKLRAQRERRAQERAVTAEDFEALTIRASRSVARARCNPPGAVSPEEGTGVVPPGTVELLVVPAVSDALREGDLSRLALDESLRSEIPAYLDRYRLLTTTVRVREPSYLGVVVHAEIVPSEFLAPDVVVERVSELLRLYLSPLAIETQDERLAAILDPGWEGWPFGQDLYVSELYARIQQVPGVKHVLDVRLGYRPVAPRQEAGTLRDAEGDEVPLTDERTISVPADTLLCLLEAEIEVISL